MQLASKHIPTAALIAIAAATAWLAHTTQPVHAAESGSGSLQFQMQGIGQDAQLTVYDGQGHTLYVYQGINTGSDVKGCSYQLHVDGKGGPLKRKNCGITAYPGN